MFYIDKQGRKVEFTENYTAEEKKGKRCFTDPSGIEHCVDDNSKVESFEMPSIGGVNLYYIGGGVLAVALIVAIVMYMRKQKKENYEPSSSSSEASIASFGFRFA